MIGRCSAFRGKELFMKVRIFYHHTDCGGVVYYANYLKFLEEARTEFFEDRGLSMKALTDKDTLFVVARQEIDYKLPAVYGDILEVTSWVTETSGVRVNFDAEIKKQTGQLVSKAKTFLVCVGRDLRPRPIPEDVKQKITGPETK